MELHRTNHGQIKRDLATNKRLRRLSDGNFEPVPLNLGLGTHYTWVYAGSPPQRASVIVDTGSHLMAFPCNGYAHPSCNVVVPNSCIRCDGCGTHTDAPFDTTKSSSLTYPSCASHLTSFTCGVCGLDDRCHISQVRTPNHPRLFISQVADGIMGVANTENNLMRKLHAEHKLDTSAFALCFAPQGGTMAIGTLSTAHHSTDVQYAAVTSSRNGYVSDPLLSFLIAISRWYGVTVIALTFGGTNLPIDASFMGAGRNVIVDSGTTDSYLPSAYADAWNDLFFKTTGLKYAAEGGGCDDTTYPDDVVQAMPAFDITMLVLGANFMMHHEFVFDPDAKRVGFSKAQCASETSPPTSTTGKVLVNDTVGATLSSNFRGKTDMSGEFSLLSAAVAMCLALVVIGSAYHFWYKRRNKSSLPSTGKSPHWAPVSQIQSDPDERVPLGEEPLSRRGDEEDESDGDEFFDSEGYVMSPRSIKRCRDAFDLDA
ncbi:hypothetical protein DYB30_006027 [Aphanomyces astaci]|uniref:Peptidase A1 domain-containing protein n=1 Tax=Aphanomyces astaci TaxID=112090 RepID=A0A397CSW0_APHAT|nr:hypothetical protein DYB30_006027 [Aphanomyces astaci]